MTRYTWHQEQWLSIETRLQQDRLPHALLLTGPKGIGKLEFAQALVANLMCSQTIDMQACGSCQSCKLIAAGTHPDKKQLTFEVNRKDGSIAKELKIDQIRSMTESLALTAYLGGYKVAIVYPAERMNQNAANGILKLLEEPTKNTLLILVTNFSSRLSPTIRSRCQKIRFTLPSQEQTKQWLNDELPGVAPEPLLAMSNGAPLQALKAGKEGWLEMRNNFYSQLITVSQYKLSPVTLAARLAQQPMDLLVVWGISWVNDLIKLYQVKDVHKIVNEDYRQVLSELAFRAELQALYIWYDDQIKLQTLVHGSLNSQQLLEKNLLDWQGIFKS